MAERTVLSLADVRTRRTRVGYRIEIKPGLIGHFEVRVEPPTTTHPLRGFRLYADALAWAEEVRRVEGWPIMDSCDDGPRAA